MWHYGICTHSPFTFVGVVHSTWHCRAMWHMHAPTFNKWHYKKKKMQLHILTRGCGLTSLMVYINEKIRDIRERNMTIRSEIWTMNIRSLGFRDIREWVILWGLILRSLGCIYAQKLPRHWSHALHIYIQGSPIIEWLGVRGLRQAHHLLINRSAEKSAANPQPRE